MSRPRETRESTEKKMVKIVTDSFYEFLPVSGPIYAMSMQNRTFDMFHPKNYLAIEVGNYRTALAIYFSFKDGFNLSDCDIAVRAFGIENAEKLRSCMEIINKKTLLLRFLYQKLLEEKR